MLEAFSDSWYWEYICSTWGSFWNSEKIRKYSDRVNWSALSSNVEINFTPELLKEFESKWIEQFLTDNEGFVEQVVKPNITEELIGKFMNLYQ